MSSSTGTNTTIVRPQPEDLVPAPIQAQDELVASDTDKSSVSPGAQTVEGDDEVLIVDWDGPNDPENPKNWPSRRKWTAAGVVAAFTFISPVTSSIGAPAGAAIARNFGIHNESFVAMTVSIYVLAYAFGPLILAPLCEVFGRSRVMMASNAVFLAWNIGCGFAQNAGQLLGFRFIAGLGGSAPLAIGGAVLSDCFRPEERGRAISLFSLAPILGPTLGPVAGAWIVQRTTWRWVYWGTSIIDAVIISVAFLIFEETYPPVLLKRKAKRIAKSLDPEKGPPRVVRTPFQTQDRSVRKLLSASLLRPFRFFVTESIVQLLGLYMAFLYAVIYLTFTTLPSIYQKTYRESFGISGLHYIALGVGIMITAQVTARALDWSLVYYTKKNGGSMQPEYRLPCSIPGTIAMPIGLPLLGWGAQKHVHWIVPDIGLAFIGCGMVSNSISIQAYIVDTYKLYAASEQNADQPQRKALAAVSCLRCLFAFTFPLFAPYMYNALGYGKGNTILAVVAIVLGCPAPWFFMKYGRRIRARSKFTPTMLEGRI